MPVWCVPVCGCVPVCCGMHINCVPSWCTCVWGLGVCAYESHVKDRY